MFCDIAEWTLDKFEEFLDDQTIDLEEDALLFRTLRARRIDLVECCLKRGANPNTFSDNNRPLIFEAVLRDYAKPQEFTKTMLKYGADPNACDNNGTGEAVIFFAADLGACLVPFIQHGADLALTDQKGRTILERSMSSNWPMALILLAAGAPYKPPTRKHMVYLVRCNAYPYNEEFQMGQIKFHTFLYGKAYLRVAEEWLNERGEVQCQDETRLRAFLERGLDLVEVIQYTLTIAKHRMNFFKRKEK